MKNISIIFSISILIACTNTNQLVITPGNDPNFSIVSHKDKGLSHFNRKVTVFGIDIYAVAQVEDEKLLHAANVMAQYLDNDEDGKPDNPVVLKKMQEEAAFMVMWKRERDLYRVSPPEGRLGQDLGNDETHPTFVRKGKKGPFDASLEEVLHIITHAGYAKVYPKVFGEVAGSQIAKAMDIARGGQFFDIPNPYPDTAWYSYDDETCEYDCMITEYHYWALTSILGAQENRLPQIQQEWKLNSLEKVKRKDTLIYQLLTNPIYQFPTILPDGRYKQ